LLALAAGPVSCINLTLGHLMITERDSGTPRSPVALSALAERTPATTETAISHTSAAAKTPLEREEDPTIALTEGDLASTSTRSPHVSPAASTIAFVRDAFLLLVHGVKHLVRRGQLLMLRSQRVLIAPSVQMFDLVRPSDSWADTIGAATSCGAVVGMLYAVRRPWVHGPLAALAVGALGGLSASIVLVVTAACVVAGPARLLGGRGSVRAQAYLLALASGPLAVCATLASFVPVVSGAVSVVVSLYGFALAVMATSSAFRLPRGRAFAAVLLGVFLVTLALLVALAALVLVVLKTSSLP
jgi:hypothetical protein